MKIIALLLCLEYVMSEVSAAAGERNSLVNDVLPDSSSSNEFRKAMNECAEMQKEV